MRARAKIADLGAPFIRPGARVLTHGNSRVVLALLRRAVAQVTLLACTTLGDSGAPMTMWSWLGPGWQPCHYGLPYGGSGIQGVQPGSWQVVWKVVRCKCRS